jgi:tRNA A37 threonylcarbamoyladenosine dehydratase
VRIVFCGVGALGSSAVVACRNLDATLVLVDFDRVESKNTLSQAFVKPSVGKNKADALKLQLANFWGVKAEAFGVRVTEENVATLCGSADLVVDAFDNAKSRRLSRCGRARPQSRSCTRPCRRMEPSAWSAGTKPSCRTRKARRVRRPAKAESTCR